MTEKNDLEILKMFVKMDFILRYQNSALGFLWVFLKPFLIFSVLLTVFHFFMGNQVENYSLYLLLGIILYQFFADGTNFGMHAILNKANVILKIPFSKTSVVLAGVLSALLHFFFASVIFFGFLFFNGIFPGILAVGTFAVLAIATFFLALGISFFASLWIISFRDLGQIWEVFLTALFYLVPIFYPMSIIPENLRAIFWLNPLTQIITFARDTLIYGKTISISELAILFFGTMIFCAIGYFYFRKSVQKFAEKI